MPSTCVLELSISTVCVGVSRRRELGKSCCVEKSASTRASPRPGTDRPAPRDGSRGLRRSAARFVVLAAGALGSEGATRGLMSRLTARRRSVTRSAGEPQASAGHSRGGLRETITLTAPATLFAALGGELRCRPRPRSLPNPYPLAARNVSSRRVPGGPRASRPCRRCRTIRRRDVRTRDRGADDVTLA